MSLTIWDKSMVVGGPDNIAQWRSARVELKFVALIWRSFSISRDNVDVTVQDTVHQKLCEQLFQIFQRIKLLDGKGSHQLIILNRSHNVGHKEDMIVLNGVLNDSAQLQAGMASKKTAFAPFPNTTNWLDLDQRVNGSDELPENDIQPNHPQVRNLRLVLEEKKRKLQTEATKKGNEWMQQVAKVGETVFMHSGVNQIPPSHSQPEEHVYEEINGGLLEEDSPGYQAVQQRRGKWHEQEEFGPGAASVSNTYATRQPPKPLPRRNASAVESLYSKIVRPPQNGSVNANVDGNVEYKSVDGDGSLPASRSQDGFSDRVADDGAHQFLSSELPQRPVKFKPKVIRNPANNVVNGHSTVNLSSSFGGASLGRIAPQSSGVRKDFIGSINVLNPDQEVKRIPVQSDPREEAVDDEATGFDLVDETDDLEMERRKRKLLENQIKRRQEQEAARQAKEMQNNGKAERDRQRQEETLRKREEEKVRRQIVFEEYQKRKAQAKLAEELSSPQGGPPVTMRESKARRARPLSVHANSVTTPTMPPPVTENDRMKKSPSQGDIMRVDQELSILSLHNPRLAAASARHFLYTERRALSPPGGRSRTFTTDSISDAGSVNSGQDTYAAYTGPRLFKKPSSKSNRLITHNAVRDCCLPGIVNEDVQKKVLDTLARSDGSHFLVLFRDANCQFKGLYAYDTDINEAIKIFGAGPMRIDDTMTEKLYKYNSGSKKFAVVPTTHHMSVQIDGITIQAALWYGKKTSGLKPPLDMF